LGKQFNFKNQQNTKYQNKKIAFHFINHYCQKIYAEHTSTSVLYISEDFSFVNSLFHFLKNLVFIAPNVSAVYDVFAVAGNRRFPATAKMCLE
jgi:hypothetical protein